MFIRLLFYGLTYAIVYVACNYWTLEVLGKDGFKFFGPAAGLFALIQTLNFLIIGKVADIEKKELSIGHWPKERLRAAMAKTRYIAFSRSVVGIVLAVVVGLVSAWMSYLDLSIIPVWLLALAATLIFLSLVILPFTLYGYYRTIQFESELLVEIERLKNKKSSLDDLNKTD